MADQKLEKYRAKRDFSKSPEPKGRVAATGGSRFVIHKHHATADHYDLRLELDGVLKSWAVPRGPSLNPADKRYAAETEDHPLQYIDFEGVIPAGEYGAGPMIVWDTGTWAPMGDAAEGLRAGDFKFRLWGEKLKGGWVLVRMKPKPGSKKTDWLFLKERDQAVDTEIDILATRPESVKTGRKIEELVAAPKLPEKPLPKPAKLEPGKLAGAVKARMASRIEPQLATSVDNPPSGPDWIHEIKFDGYRTMAHVTDGTARFVTRGGLDWSKRYGFLGDAFAALNCREAAIDGEVVVLDDKGISRFAALQDALSTGASERLVFYAFDLVHLDGYDLRKVPLMKRKALLARLVGPVAAPNSALQLSDHFDGDGQVLLDHAAELGLEGIVSKRASGAYVEGRSKTWLKAKAKLSRDFVIAGYTESEVADGIAAIAVGEFVDGELVYRGRVGTGFDAATLVSLHERLAPLADASLTLVGATKDVIPVRPILSAHVHFSNITTDGSVRHGVFKGLREPELAAGDEIERTRYISDADLANIWVTNPDRRLFGKSGPTKLDIAVYYALVGDFMLPHIMGRPVSLVRCPTGLPKDCFFQRHAFKGMPPSVATFEMQTSDEEDRTYIAVEDAKAYLALAQFGVVEFHAWGSLRKAPEKPDRVVFDLDPGQGITWREVVEAGVHIRGELEALGLVPYVKTSGGKGLHVVVPIKSKVSWKQVHDASGAIASKIAAGQPETFTATMGASNRKKLIFIDFHRNARSATAAAPYSLRARTNLPASAPLSWDNLESIDAPEDLNYSSLPGLLTTTGDPWADINEFARELPPHSKTRK